MSRCVQLLDRGTLSPSKPFSMASLPNEAGFEFVGFLADYSRVMCRVVKDDFGLHRVEGESFENLIGWRYPATLENMLR